MKWFSLGLGTLLGVSHIGMIGMIASRKTYPVIHPPVITPYTSYVVSADKDGYKMSYVGNDPKTMYKTTKVKEKGGFLGLADENQEIVEEYTMEGDAHIQKNHIGSPVASEKNEACVKAIGSAEGTGRLVGTSVGAAAAPTLSTIPFVGWVAAGWVAMFGGNQGAEIGGNMAEDMNKNC